MFHRYMPGNFDRSDSVADRDFLWAALDYAVDGVLPDPTDQELVLAVEELVERRIPKGYEDRFRRAIASVFDDATQLGFAEQPVSQADADHFVISAVNVYGLC